MNKNQNHQSGQATSEEKQAVQGQDNEGNEETRRDVPKQQEQGNPGKPADKQQGQSDRSADVGPQNQK